MKLRNNAYTVFMAFLEGALQKKLWNVLRKNLSIFFLEHPAYRLIQLRKCDILFILIKFTCIHGFSFKCFFCRAPCTYHVAKWLATCAQKVSPVPNLVVPQLMPCLKCLWSGGSSRETLKRYSLPFSLHSCESWMFVKEIPSRKKIMSIY